MNKFLESMLKKTSLIPINFDEAEVCTMKKDAKAILSNMIGNIGGTLGVFIKFSFIGVLTSMTDFFLYLHGHVSTVGPVSSGQHKINRQQHNSTYNITSRCKFMLFYAFKMTVAIEFLRGNSKS